MMRSLRLRLLLTSSAAALGAVLATGIAVQGLFERHTEREALVIMDAELRFLARGLATPEGLDAQPLPDPRFLEPFSGLYWQVRAEDGSVRSSPSLSGFRIALPAGPPGPGALRREIAPGPEGTKLIALERLIEEAPGGAPLRVAVAVDRKILEAANRAFVLDLIPALASIAGGLLLMAMLQTLVALRPIAHARQALAEYRAGRRERLAGSLPTELEGLASEFDAVLSTLRQAARTARERAADLAHGLRTPLALLVTRARELEERGETEAAAEIAAVAARIEHRTARELARSAIRGTVPGSMPLPVAPLARRVAQAIARTSEPELSWEVEVPHDLSLDADEADVTELLGSLLDNARKWARHRIRLVVAERGGAMTATVEDDGPGIPPQDRRAVLIRGTRLDPGRAGTGLGLSIAQDIAEAYGGILQLGESPLGGLSVRVDLPLRARGGAP